MNAPEQHTEHASHNSIARFAPPGAPLAMPAQTLERRPRLLAWLLELGQRQTLIRR